jgi:hypothetical protein
MFTWRAAALAVALPWAVTLFSAFYCVAFALRNGRGGGDSLVAAWAAATALRLLVLAPAWALVSAAADVAMDMPAVLRAWLPLGALRALAAIAAPPARGDEWGSDALAAAAAAAGPAYEAEQAYLARAPLRDGTGDIAVSVSVPVNTALFSLYLLLRVEALAKRRAERDAAVAAAVAAAAAATAAAKRDDGDAGQGDRAIDALAAAATTARPVAPSLVLALEKARPSQSMQSDPRGGARGTLSDDADSIGSSRGGGTATDPRGSVAPPIAQLRPLFRGLNLLDNTGLRIGHASDVWAARERWHGDQAGASGGPPRRAPIVRPFLSNAAGLPPLRTTPIVRPFLIAGPRGPPRLGPPPTGLRRSAVLPNAAVTLIAPPARQ